MVAVKAGIITNRQGLSLRPATTKLCKGGADKNWIGANHSLTHFWAISAADAKEEQ